MYIDHNDLPFYANSRVILELPFLKEKPVLTYKTLTTLIVV